MRIPQSLLLAKRRKFAAAAVKSGRWGIRHLLPSDPLSAHGGFRWQPLGTWTEAPDWEPTAICGHGLHLQTAKHGGYTRNGGLIAFVEYEGDLVSLDDKVKVRRARLLLVGELPGNLADLGKVSLFVKAGRLIANGVKPIGGPVRVYGKSQISLPACTRAGGDVRADGESEISLPACTRVGWDVRADGKSKIIAPKLEK